MSPFAFSLVTLAAFGQLDDSPLEVAPTVVEAAPMEEDYIQITRSGVPVAQASYKPSVSSPPAVKWTMPTHSPAPVQAQRPVSSGVQNGRAMTMADVPPSLPLSAAPLPSNGPIGTGVQLAPNQYPEQTVILNPGVPTTQSLFTNGYGGTRAQQVILPPAVPGQAYQPITAPVARPVVPNAYVGRGVVGQAKLYQANQPVRNFFRWLSP